MSGDGPLLDERARETAACSRTLAPFGRRALTVTANEPLGAYRVLKVADPRGPAPQAGQFAMLAAVERWGGGEDERPYLPRAFSYARWLAGEAHFLLEDVGPGTHRLCELREGDELWLLGPLGQGFAMPLRDRDAVSEHDAIPDGDRRALLVGGGVGIAPLAILRDRLVSVGPTESAGDAGKARPTVLLGFRDRAHAEGAHLVVPHKLSDDADAASDNMLVATDDGSVGHHGLVTELLREQLDRDDRATIYACGPPPMLEAVRALCAERAVPAQLALEAGMACGFGACYGCVVPKRDGGYLRVCVDGPVVDATELERVL